MQMRTAIALSLLVAFSVACTAPAAKATPAPTTDALAGTYTGFGSTTALDSAKLVTAAFSKVHPSVVFKLNVVDTETSIVKVRNADADADFGFIGRELLATEGKVTTTPIGATGSAFAVNSANPVKSLTKAQLRSILTGAVTDWGAVGGTAGPIRVVLREPTSQTRSGLEAYVFEKGEKIVYSPGALVTTSSNTASTEMNDALKSFTGAIGMVTINSSISNKTITMLSMDGNSPTLASLTAGTWPVRRSLYITTNEDASKVQPAIKALIEYVKSPDGQKVLSGQ
jgi:ABC-type phosphate transport system substrate-binding protein